MVEAEGAGLVEGQEDGDEELFVFVLQRQCEAVDDAVVVVVKELWWWCCWNGVKMVVAWRYESGV